MYQIFLAVEHMHSHGVVHRDLKVNPYLAKPFSLIHQFSIYQQPENILLDEEQKVVKISDFGFSTFVTDNLSGNLIIKCPGALEILSLYCYLELLGTPGYLAPEMLKRSVEQDAPPYGMEIDL